MKTKTEEQELAQDEMLPEYDFTGKKGVRGKYYRAYQQGHTVKVYEEDGAVSILREAANGPSPR